MDGQAKQPKVRLTKFGWWWFGALALAMVSVWPLGHFDNATQLTPDHSDILEYCFWAAGLVAVASALVCFLQSEGSFAARALLSLLCFGMLGGLATFLVLSTVANIIEGRRDFPPEDTRTFKALLPIGRAYRTYARVGGYSWTIQPTPLWSNIGITEADYNFMLAHRRPGDVGTDPDEISSRGFFCAKVTMQKSGEALRVLHAGRAYKLAEGAVVTCPEGMTGQPYV